MLANIQIRYKENKDLSAAIEFLGTINFTVMPFLDGTEANYSEGGCRLKIEIKSDEDEATSSIAEVEHQDT